MTNLEVASILERIADLLQLSEENPFKIRAYRNAARSICNLQSDLHELYEQQRLKEIPGVGKTVQAQIEEILTTGTSAFYQELTQKIPESILDMLAVPGLGPKTVIQLFNRLGIDNLDDLEAAARAGRLREIPGLGEKTEARVLEGIKLLRAASGKYSIGLALPLAEKLVHHLNKQLPGVQVQIVGSLRRGKPLVSDVDILAGCQDSSLVEAVLADYSGIDLREKQADRLAGYLAYGIPFEIILVRPREFHYHLFTSTGSKAHRVRILDALQTASPASFASEAQLYRHLHMAYIPPELREDRGEIDAARENRLPQLVELRDIKGDLHVHSNWSDGSCSLAELAEAARLCGFKYIAITDHSHSLPITGGLNPERLNLQTQLIEQLNRQQPGLHILRGIEVDILKDGSLDLSDKDLEQLDIVIASIHSYFRLNREDQTRRLLRAIENPHVDIIGHLTGRMLNKRSGYDFDLERILRAAAQNRKVLEINAHPSRLDIDEQVARRAVSLGIKVAINSDAHNLTEMDLLRYGVFNARRGWVEAADVINTWELKDILAYFQS